jgi:hypothetical protein
LIYPSQINPIFTPYSFKISPSKRDYFKRLPVNVYRGVAFTQTNVFFCYHNMYGPVYTLPSSDGNASVPVEASLVGFRATRCQAKAADR